jgi:hypothetical protein
MSLQFGFQTPVVCRGRFCAVDPAVVVFPHNVLASKLPEAWNVSTLMNTGKWSSWYRRKHAHGWCAETGESSRRRKPGGRLSAKWIRLVQRCQLKNREIASILICTYSCLRLFCKVRNTTVGTPSHKQICARDNKSVT